MTTPLNSCPCGVAACEQVRNAMGPGDYKEQQKVNNKGRMIEDLDYHKRVHLDDYNKDDFRISCTQCDNATPWDHAYFPENADEATKAGVGELMKERVRKLWNEIFSKRCEHEPVQAQQKP